MALPVGLLVKGLLGTSAVTTATVSIVFKDQIGNWINNLLDTKDSLNEKIKKLGITETTCLFGDNLEPKTCTLNADKLKKVNFRNKGENDLTIAGLDSSKTVKLVIERGHYSLGFPSGLRFTFTNTDTTTEVKIGETNNEIKLLQNTSYDFKIKTENDKLKLEEAWDLTTLNGIAGVTCETPSEGSEITQCNLTSGKVNVWKANDDYITGATVTTGSKISVAKDSQNHKNGFKFTVTSDISLTEGNKSKATGGIDKLTQSNSTSYEIDLKDDNGTKKWFLVEKPTASSVPQESQ